MTNYQPHGLTTVDARRLIGSVADITAWDDDERRRKVVYRSVTVLGVTGRHGTWLTIATNRHPKGLNVPFSEITAVTRIRRAS